MELNYILGKSAITVTAGKMTLLFSQGEIVSLRKGNEAYLLDGLNKEATKKHLKIFLKGIKKICRVDSTWFQDLAIILPE